jgi:polyisoprenoid-binding protein YceI
MKRTLVFFFACALVAWLASAAETYKVDRNHSDVVFEIRHLVSKVTGRFGEFDALLIVDKANPAGGKMDFTINVASIDTKVPDRDKHLRSADFFDVEKFPEIRFRSTKIVPAGTDRYDVTGDFTMRGVTKQVTLPVEVLGVGKDQRGNERIGFEVDTKLNRKDYGIVWNRALDEGGVVLGDDVRVRIALSMVKQSQPAASK